MASGGSSLLQKAAQAIQDLSTAFSPAPIGREGGEARGHRPWPCAGQRQARPSGRG